MTLSPSAEMLGGTLRTCPREAYVECWLTVPARPDLPARAMFDEVARVLKTHGIEPIQEKVYGMLDARAATLAARVSALRSAGLDPTLPVTYLQGAPVDGGAVAGIQLWGAIPRAGTRIETIWRAGAAAGRCLSGPGFRMLHLASVRGAAAEGGPSRGVTEEAERMFAQATAMLEANGMTYPMVVRTWIYLARLLHWYGEFNRVRTAFFEVARVGPVFSASTGMQGRGGLGECLMDLLAVQSEPGVGLEVRPLLASSRQGPAAQYGSTFSRGMSLGMDGRRTVLVSGTASIGPDGRTRYPEAPEAQILETLLNVAALLEPLGGGLQDITSATLFCKEPAVFASFRHVTALLGIPTFPTISVVADVCRSDLLVEVEAVASIPTQEDLH